LLMMTLSGIVLCERFRLDVFLSEGGFGQVYIARCLQTNNQLAVKIERQDCKLPLLMKESECLQELDFFANNQKTAPVPQFYCSGETADLRYMFMELHGSNVRDIKKMTMYDRFSLPTSLWIFKKMLEAIAFVHQHGWIHRDIKPPNFCLNIGGHRRLVLVDFGTCERSDSTMKSTGFCGTERYASLRTHQKLVAHENDDLWSLYYIVVENINGQLPWRGAPSREIIAQLKKSVQEDVRIIHSLVSHPWFIVAQPPSSMKLMLRLLSGSSYASKFDYNSLISEIERDMKLRNFDENHSALDWELSRYALNSGNAFTQMNPFDNLPSGSPYCKYSPYNSFSPQNGR